VQQQEECVFLQNVGMQTKRPRMSAQLEVEKRENAELRLIVSNQREQMEGLSKQVQETEQTRMRDKEEMSKKQAELEAKLELVLVKMDYADRYDGMLDVAETNLFMLQPICSFGTRVRHRWWLNLFLVLDFWCCRSCWCSATFAACASEIKHQVVSGAWIFWCCRSCWCRGGNLDLQDGC
jgi:hypothetical protein